MQRGLVNTLQRKWAAMPSLDHLGALRPRPVDAIHELVFLVDTSGGRTEVAPDEVFEAAPILLARRDDEWLVAGFSDRPPEPGWPPKTHDDRVVRFE